MVSSLFCRMMILMLQQQQVNQQMQHQQNVSQYLQGQYANAPWWTDAAMSYWPPGPPEPPAGAMSKAKASPKEPAPVKPPAEGAGLGKGDGISSEPTAAEPAALLPLLNLQHQNQSLLPLLNLQHQNQSLLPLLNQQRNISSRIESRMCNISSIKDRIKEV